MLRTHASVLALVAGLATATSARAATPEQWLLQYVHPASSAPATGQIVSITSPDTLLSTSPSDLASFNASAVAGFTLDISFQGLSAAGVVSAYNPGTFASPNLSFTVTSAGYTVTTGGATLGAVSRTCQANQYLRQPWNGIYVNWSGSTASLIPNELVSGGILNTGWVSSCYIWKGDVLSNFTAAGSLYNGNVTSLATGLTLANNNTIIPPVADCDWVDPQGERIGTAGITVEVACEDPYGMNGSPVAGIEVDLIDGSGHTATTYVPGSAMALSQRKCSSTGTASNGSNVVTGVTDIACFIAQTTNNPGMRPTVAGSGGNIPGEPLLQLKTYTSGQTGSLTFSQNVTVTTNAFGLEQITSTPKDGEAWCDGCLTNATITDTTGLGGTFGFVAPSGTGSTSGSSVNIALLAPGQGQWAVGQFVFDVGGNIPINDFIKTATIIAGGACTCTLNVASTASVSGTVTAKNFLSTNVFTGAAPTAVFLSTKATSGTAGSGNSATVNQNYVGGGSDTVRITGNGSPVPVFRAAFTDAQIVAAGLVDGVVIRHFKAFPWVVGGTVGSPDIGPLDSTMGADGTGYDWFHIYYNVAGTYAQPCTTTACFAFFGTQNSVALAELVSPNLKNITNYLDRAGAQAPKWAWVGAAGGSPAVQSTNADPGAAAYYGSVAAAATGLAASYSSGKANGGIICLTAAGTYNGTHPFGASILASYTNNLSPGLLSSALPSGTAGTGGPGGTCPGFGGPQAGGADNSDTTVAFSGATADALPLHMQVHNVSLTGTFTVLKGGDSTVSTTTNTWPYNYHASFDGIIFKPGATQPIVDQLGSREVYNSVDDDAAHLGDLFTVFSNNSGWVRLSMGNLFVGGTFGAAGRTYNPKTSLGSIEFNPLIQNVQGQSLATLNYYFQATSVLWLYNGAFAMNATAEFDATTSAVPILGSCYNVWEMSGSLGGQPAYWGVGGDNSYNPVGQWGRCNEVVIGQRSNLVYMSDPPPGVSLSSTTLGHLPASTGGYILQIDRALRTNPTVESNTSGNGGTATATTSGATNQLSFTVACDPNYVYTPYVYQVGTATWFRGQTVSGTDLTQLSACSIGATTVANGIGAVGLTLINYLGTQINPLVPGVGVPAKTVMKGPIIFVGNIDVEAFGMDDLTVHNSGFSSPAHFGSHAYKNMVDGVGNVWQSWISVTGSDYHATCYLCNFGTSAALNTGTSVVYTDDRSLGQLTNYTLATGTNTGYGNYVPASGNAGVNMPLANQQYPTDFLGLPHVANDNAGAYTKAAH